MKESELVPIYIVISQTGTILSRILKFITRKDYNHASISLREDLHMMYSFGRINAYNPISGGFVRESTRFGSFKRFYNTSAVVLRAVVTQEEYAKIESLISHIADHPTDYKYNYAGLFLAGLHICFRKERCYYCSEFVREVLAQANVSGVERLKPIVHPTNFLNIPEFEAIYFGKLRDYCITD